MSFKEISCSDFFLSTKKFISDNFEGAMKIDFSETENGFINVSPRGFAFFIKLLLSEIHGNSMIYASMDNEDGRVCLRIEQKGGLAISKRLEDVAERSGFSVFRDRDSITLFTKINSPSVFTIHAKDSLTFIFYYYEVFLMQKSE